MFYSIPNWVDDHLLGNQFKNLMTTACFGELNSVALEIVKHFKSNTGNIFTNDILTKHVKSHPSTLRFCKSMEKIIKERLNDNHFDFSKISYKENNNGDDTPRKIDEEWGHPRLDYKKGKDSVTDFIKSFSGLYMIMHDIWSHEVFISDFIKTEKEISITYTVILYDHFGLDINDICCKKSERSTLIGFRAWFILQHARNFKPFITKAEFTKTFKIDI